MRTTLDLDDDVLRAARELARRQNLPAGRVVSSLLRKALTGDADPAPRRAKSAVGGFRPFASGGRVVDNELIDSLRDAEGA
ncbi:MAG: CopG family transcriptional regulator [Rubrivivax sp.]